jgi:hypothetical protein
VPPYVDARHRPDIPPEFILGALEPGGAQGLWTNRHAFVAFVGASPFVGAWHRPWAKIGTPFFGAWHRPWAKIGTPFSVPGADFGPRGDTVRIPD